MTDLQDGELFSICAKTESDVIDTRGR